MTRAELIRQVLENLKVIDEEDNPSAAQVAAVGRRVDQESARLSEVGLIWWPSDDIPASVAGSFARLCATASQDIYGKVYDSSGAQAAIAAVKSSAGRDVVRTAYF